jgi:hypothetical protein
MATLLDLITSGSLFKLDPSLEPGDQEYRFIIASPLLRTWIEKDLPKLESTWNVELSPLEQLDALVEVFCSGQTLMFDHQFKPLRHIRDGIWELKTADLRMFGWFYRKDYFIGWRALPTDYVKRHNLYYGLADETARFREGVDLDNPKFVSGDNPHDVVSDFSYP